MRTYRPVSCLGIALGNVPPCTGCLRLVPSIDADQLRIKPEVRDGKCEDFIAGRRPVAPVRVTPAADLVPVIMGIDFASGDGSEDLPWFGMDLGRENDDQ